MKRFSLLVALLLLLLLACERRRAASPWEDMKEMALVPADELVVGGSFVWSTASFSTFTLASNEMPMRVEVTDFEGRGLRTIGTISSAGVFTLDSSLRCHP